MRKLINQSARRVDYPAWEWEWRGPLDTRGNTWRVVSRPGCVRLNLETRQHTLAAEAYMNTLGGAETLLRMALAKETLADAVQLFEDYLG